MGEKPPLLGEDFRLFVDAAARIKGVKGLRVQVMDFSRLYYNEYENDSFRHGLLTAFLLNLVFSIP
jgi:hypothetical protein